MRTRSLGKSGIEVGEIGLGTWGLSGEAYGPVDPATARATLVAALEAGTTFIETAACYGPDGFVETLIGDVLRERGQKDVVVSTRIGVDRRAGGDTRKRFDPGSLTAQAEGSLRRLGRECVDALVLHNPLPTTLYDYPSPIDTLKSLRDQGKTRLVGVSIGSVEVGRAALKHGVDLLVVPYNLLFPRLLHELAADVAQAGVAVVARSPLAYGLLADSWEANRVFGENDHRNDRWSPADLDRRIRQRKTLRFLVGGAIASLREASIRYVLANQLVSVVAVGARTPEQAQVNAHAAETLPYLPEDDLVRLGKVLQSEGIMK